MSTPVPARPRLAWAVSDTLVLVGRSVRHIARNPEQVAVAVALPIMLLLVFRYLFGGAIDGGTGAYANYLIPGIITISIAFNATTTTTGMATDLQEGIVERFRSMPMVATAVLTGHVAAAIIRNLISLVVVCLAGLLVGFRPEADPLQWLGAIAMLVLFVTALSWLAVIFGLLADSIEAATGLSMIIVFLPYTSSALVPSETLPTVLRAVVENHPITAVIETVRALIFDQSVGNHWWVALIWWVGLLLVLIPLAGSLFRKRSAK